MSNISQFDAVRIQARALIPVIKAVEAELGKEKTHRIVGNAIAESYAEFLSGRLKERNKHPGETDEGFDRPAVSDVVEHTDSTYSTNVTKCGYAEYFQKKGEPEIGYLLTCGVDFAVNDALRPNWELRRTQTLMEGASHCNFRYTLK